MSDDSNMLVDAAPLVYPDAPGGSLGLTGTQQYWYDSIMGNPMPPASQPDSPPSGYQIEGAQPGSLDKGASMGNGLPMQVEPGTADRPAAPVYSIQPAPKLKEISYDPDNQTGSLPYWDDTAAGRPMPTMQSSVKPQSPWMPSSGGGGGGSAIPGIVQGIQGLTSGFQGQQGLGDPDLDPGEAPGSIVPGDPDPDPGAGDWSQFPSGDLGA